MSDLLVHYAVGHVGGKVTSSRATAVLFILGNFLPDIVYKTFLVATNSDTWFCEPSHAPLPLIMICLIVSQLFEESFRPRAFWALLLGSYAHIFVDAFKTYMGHGVIMWAFPFSTDRFEFGLYQPEDSVYLMGPALGLILIVEGIGWLSRKAALRAK